MSSQVGQWDELVQCMQKIEDNGDGELSKRLRLCYRQYEIPLDIRSGLASWIESVAWNDVQADDIEMKGQELYNEMLGHLSKLMKQKDFTQNLSLRTKESEIKDRYKCNPGDLVRNMRACLTQERLLIDSTKAKNKGPEQERPKGYYTVKSKMDDINNQCNEFEHRLHELQRKTTAFREFYQTYTSDMKSLQKESAGSNLTEDQKKRIQTKIHQNQEKCNNETLSVYEERKKSKEKLLEISTAVLDQLKEVWTSIDTYEKQQKLSVLEINLGPPDGALKDLNDMCEAVNQMLISLQQYFGQVSSEFSKINFDKDPFPLEVTSAEELFNKEFEKHLQRIVVIDHHPHQVLKISKGRSLTFVMSLRILGPKSLGLHANLPSVTANLHQEKDLPTQIKKDKVDKGICTIHGAENVKGQFKTSTGQLTVNFSSAQITSVKRPENRNREERVTELKYGMIFSTNLNICDKVHNIKKLSLPLILTSQSSQEWAAKGTLFWDACFSEDEREFYKDASRVKWSSVADLINLIFKANTSRGLEQEQLNYLAQRVFGGNLNDDFSDVEITKEKFIKDNLPEANFSLWKWVYACLNLIKECLRKEWEQGLIMGFVSRQRTDELLQKCRPGTFLLRFKTSSLHETQSATICAILTPAAVIALPGGEQKVSHMNAELTQQKMAKKSLASYLHSTEVRDCNDRNIRRPVFTTLYPNTPFEDAFRDMLIDSENGPSNYDDMIDKVEVKIGELLFNDTSSIPGSPARSEMSIHTNPDSECAASPSQEAIPYMNVLMDSELFPEMMDFNEVEVPSDSVYAETCVPHVAYASVGNKRMCLANADQNYVASDVSYSEGNFAAHQISIESNNTPSPNAYNNIAPPMQYNMHTYPNNSQFENNGSFQQTNTQYANMPTSQNAQFSTGHHNQYTNLSSPAGQNGQFNNVSPPVGQSDMFSNLRSPAGQNSQFKNLAPSISKNGQFNNLSSSAGQSGQFNNLSPTVNQNGQYNSMPLTVGPTNQYPTGASTSQNAQFNNLSLAGGQNSKYNIPPSTEPEGHLV